MKLCECGCGAPAPLARATDRTRGYVKGRPTRFIAGHHLRHPEFLERSAAAKRGVARSEATRAKISAALTGRTDLPAVRAKKVAAAQRGCTSPVWVGDNASYNAIHNRARLELPDVCEHEDGSCRGMLEVALRHGLPAELLRTSPRGHRYYVGAAIAAGYMRLCRSHHRRHDA